MNIACALLSVLVMSYLLSSCSGVYGGANSTSDVMSMLEMSTKDKRNFYGIGQGQDLETAQQSAIRSLALGIQANIEYSASSRTYEGDSRLEISRIEETSISSSLRDMKGIEIHKTRNKGQFFAVAKLSKGHMAAQLIDKIREQKETIKNMLGGCKYGPVNKMQEIKHIASKLRENTSLLYSIVKIGGEEIMAMSRNEGELGGIMATNNGETNADNTPENTGEDYTYILASKPRFKVVYDDTSAIISDAIGLELSKFMRIDQSSKSILHVRTIRGIHNYSIYLGFYNCTGSNDFNIRIDSDGMNLESEHEKTRIGAKLYKALAN